MSKSWPLVALGEVLRKSEESVPLDPNTTYREVTIKLWGKGVVLRREASGSEIAAPRRSVVRPGQFILSRIDARNGAFGIVPPVLDGAVVSNDFPSFNLNTQRIVPEYLGWLSRTENFVDLCKAASEGTTNRVRLKEERFLATSVALPPLEDQQRIVARIEELAAKIEEARGLRRQAVEEAEALFSTAITSICSEKMQWATVKDVVLKQKGAVRSGPFGSQLLHEEFVEAGVPAIGTRDVQTNRFVLKSGWFVTSEKFQQLRRYQVFPGDILCTIIGGSIGRFCVVPDDVPESFTTKHVQTLTLDKSIAEPQYVSYLLNFHNRCRKSLFSKIEGSAQPSLNAEKILSTELAVPPLSDQRCIVAHLEILQAKVNVLKRFQTVTAAELDAMLPSILDKAFKGEL